MKALDTEAIRIRAAVAGGQYARDVAALLRENLMLREENAALLESMGKRREPSRGPLSPSCLQPAGGAASAAAGT